MTDQTEDGEKIVEEHQGWKNGQEVVLADVSDEFEEYGCTLGDQGTLQIVEVGAKKYGNLHVAMYFVPEGCDEGMFTVTSDQIDEA